MLVDHAASLTDEIDTLGAAPKRRGSPERAIQRAGIQWLRTVMPDGIFAAVVNEQRGAGLTSLQRARFGQARKASGVVTGFFDTVGLIAGPKTLLIEWKASGGVVSESQQRVHARARSLGHVVIVADGLEALRFGLQQHGVQYREANNSTATPAKVRLAKSKLPSDEVPF